jgi:hypothetical protein
MNFIDQVIYYHCRISVGNWQDRRLVEHHEERRIGASSLLSFKDIVTFWRRNSTASATRAFSEGKWDTQLSEGNPFSLFVGDPTMLDVAKIKAA